MFHFEGMDIYERFRLEFEGNERAVLLGIDEFPWMKSYLLIKRSKT